jgi:hypothetical protein
MNKYREKNGFNRAKINKNPIKPKKNPNKTQKPTRVGFFF